MSILTTDSEVLKNMDNYIRKQALTEFAWATLLMGKVSEIETDINPIWKKIVQTWHVNEGSTLLVSQLVEILDKENHPLCPMLRPHIGQPVYSIDCRCLCKGDAIGWLETVSKLPKSPKPILVVENITDIPEEDDKHDNPQYVRNILMHSWKNPRNDFFNIHSGNCFSINPIDYKVFITWTPEKRELTKVIREPSDGYALVDNLEKFLEDSRRPHKDKTLKELEESHIVSYK